MEDTVEDVGTRLKERRKQLGLTLEDAAQHTRIRIFHLECLENNRLSELPGPVYVIGFIKVYARYLGLDSNPLLAKVEDYRGDADHHVMKPVAVVRRQAGRPGMRTVAAGWKLAIFGTLAILLLGAAAYYLSGMFQDRATAEQALRQVAPAKGTAQPPSMEAKENSLGTGTSGSLSPVPDSHSEPADKIRTHDPLPIIPQGGGTLRMLAVSKSSLVIDIDSREPHEYQLHAGLDLSWDIGRTVKVEMAVPQAARFWLDGQELELGDLKSFQLQTEDVE